MATRNLHSAATAAKKRAKGKRLAFIDMEASGLNAKSWPVEAGWAFADGSPQSVLIQPVEMWPEDAWDDEAEALHGLSREQLHREGAPVAEACKVINSALDGCEVYSDAPDWDAFWLYRLFGAAKMKPLFSLRSFADLVRPLINGCENELFRRANEIAPRMHRAAADALHLQTVYRMASE